MNASPERSFEELVFPEGLVGCEEWKKFRLEKRPDTDPVMVLHSADQPRLSFVVADPHIWDPHYEIDLSEADLEALGLKDKQSAQILVILIVEAEPFAVTANLLGPLVINMDARKGRQVVQNNRPYSARHPIELQIRPLTFNEGLAGYPEWQNFTLHKENEFHPVKLLVSQDVPGLSFPVVSPWLIEPAYEPTLSEANRQAIGIKDDQEIEWLAIMNVQNQPFQVTANLLGPLVYNRRTGAAMQLILSDYPATQVVGGDLETVVTQLQEQSRG